jgi:NitT/TauT family transport system ATP-binding protein
MATLRVENLWMEYGEQTVLERINLEIDEGCFCAVVGASGCGKSTFLRLLLSQERPTRGRIELDGHALPEDPGPDRGVVFQRYSVFPHLTALENVALAIEIAMAPRLGRLFGKARRKAFDEAEGMLEAVGLGHALARYPAELSGGMQQRLAIAQALARRPRVLLLDEPFGALDPGTRTQMHELIGRLWSETGMTVFMVTHDIPEAFTLGTRVLVFDKVRHDPHAPGAYGATITYDLPVTKTRETLPAEAQEKSA